MPRESGYVPEQAPGERRAVGYLKHLKKVAPEILSLAEREVSVDLAKHIQLSMPPIEVESGERELVLRSNTTQSFTIPKVQPAVVDDALNHAPSQLNQPCPKVRRPLMPVVVTFPIKSRRSLLTT